MNENIPSIDELAALKEKNSEIYKLVGIIASDWATLEHSVNECIWAVAGIAPALGACITSQIWTLNGRFLALISLMKLRGFSEELVKEINSFSNRAIDPGEARNRWIHDPVVIRNDGAAGKVQVTSKRELVFEIKVITRDDLQKDVDKIARCFDSWCAIRERIVDLLPTLPEIPASKLTPIQVTLMKGP